MDSVVVSVVGFTNSIPFVYGLENSELKKEMKFEIDSPANCANKLINHEADIGLIPVAALTYLSNYQIITDYCLSTYKNVRTVILIANNFYSELDTIYLDPKSRTSNMLVQILAHKFWKNSPSFVMPEKEVDIESLGPNEGATIIGDRTFTVENSLKFQYDLAAEWHKYTKLPFVFAVWASVTPLEHKFLKKFNTALKYGVSNIDSALKKTNSLYIDAEISKIKNYLKENISYSYTKDKKKSMKVFLRYAREIRKHVSPATQ